MSFNEGLLYLIVDVMLTERSGLLWQIVNKPEIIFYDFEKRFEASSSVKIMTNRKIKSSNVRT